MIVIRGFALFSTPEKGRETVGAVDFVVVRCSMVIDKPQCMTMF
jgi:hypothetical protein